MNKLAIFVEGQTEQLLIEKLVKEIADVKSVSITKIQASGGSKNNPRLLQISAESQDSEYYVQIVDCGHDERVKSDILDAYLSLSAAGYKKIIGIRDVYPKVKYSDIPKLRTGLATSLPDGPLKILFVLGVMEIEAWFMAEHRHFQKIHPKITIERIKQELAMDLLNDDLSQRAEPAKDLSRIYWLESIPYDKSKKCIDKILSNIDFKHLKGNVCQKFEDLQSLCQELELFFSNLKVSNSTPLKIM